MPGGVPVATVALNAAKNAGILAAQIIGTFDEALSNKITDYKQHLEKEVYEKVQNLQSGNYPNSFDTK
jgi:5-(carboxyamino)imidazole ribonucleotide mutase